MTWWKLFRVTLYAMNKRLILMNETLARCGSAGVLELEKLVHRIHPSTV